MSTRLSASSTNPSPKFACSHARLQRHVVIPSPHLALLSSPANSPRLTVVVGRQKASSAKSHQQDELFAVHKVITALLAQDKDRGICFCSPGRRNASLIAGVSDALRSCPRWGGVAGPGAFLCSRFSAGDLQHCPCCRQR